jgi:hypothetical protein
MQAHVAGFDQEHERGGSEQPERGDDGMDMNNGGYGGLFVEVVAQVKAEAYAYEDPEDSEPDDGGATIGARRPGCVV